MARLGSIFPPDSPRGEGRGPDLRCAVEVYRGDLAAGAPARVRVPRSLPHGGVVVERAPDPHAPGELLELHLPADVSSGATVRLRGQGGAGAGGFGDLYLELRVLDGRSLEPPAPRRGWVVGLLVAVGAGIGFLAAALWGG